MPQLRRSGPWEPPPLGGLGSGDQASAIRRVDPSRPSMPKCTPLLKAARAERTASPGEGIMTGEQVAAVGRHPAHNHDIRYYGHPRHNGDKSPAAAGFRLVICARAASRL
ncbi:hypothetical protein SPHINGO391_210016 [Sphingomonas aurantiaca]|uniref:Uncharacterized protein n=1 Tax=Sphingomonas aurantiaca TaxID=185949 RepID=A0A5E7XXH7_9SPHN|nr:hypothetical protein SPHINGO391_210016 [Sphingomonas aurantiaca]